MNRADSRRSRYVEYNYMSADDLIRFLIQEAGACVARKQHAQALLLLSKAFLQAPDQPATFAPLATLCQLLRRPDDLDRYCRLRLQELPDDGEALYHLAASLLARDRFVEGIEAFESLLVRQPHHVNGWIDLGCAVKKFGEIDRALSCFRHALALDSTNAIANDNYLFALLFSPRYRPEEIAAEHCRWGAAVQVPATPPILHLPAHGEKMRIGYLSPDFREHSVTSFFEPLLKAHDRTAVEIFCYHSHDEEDQVTGRLRTLADHWRSIAEFGAQVAAGVIAADRLHILVELAGHTAWNRLDVMNIRPAPMQVTWLGYPHSTGLAAIDYRISDTVSDPPGDSETFHSEQIWRLPEPFLCYQPPAGAPPVAIPPVLRNGFVTFCSFNNFAKVNDDVIALWRTLLCQLPTARLLLKSEIFADQQACDMIIRRFKLPPDRLILVGKTPDRAAHLALYGQVDIALDTFPYNGTTTTCEALYMGVPVITVLGRHHAARVGGDLLGVVGIGELVAGTAEQYVDLAVQLAQNVERLQQLRETLRERVLQSPLMDGRGFAARMEHAFALMLQHTAGG